MFPAVANQFLNLRARIRQWGVECGRGSARTAVVASLVLAFLAPCASAQSLAFEPVAAGVYVHIGQQSVWELQQTADIANLSFVVGDRCVAVIDTGSIAAIGERIQSSVRAVSNKPVCYVINTHAHPDHMLGNSAFDGQGVTFVAHHNMASAIATRGPSYLRAVRRELGAQARGTELVSPGIAVRDSYVLDLGGRELHLRAWPTAHTNVDLTVLDPATGTLWLGDLAFVGHLPVLDGNLNGWLEVMDELAKLPARHVVPGHGAVESHAWPAMLDKQRDYLVALRDTVRNAIRDGLTLAQALKQVRVGAEDGWLLYDEFHQRNVSAAYAELEWE